MPNQESQPNKGSETTISPTPYKTSIWGALIDSTLALIVTNVRSQDDLTPQTRKLMDWVDWMASEGYQASGMDVGDKTQELLAPPEQDYHIMLDEFLMELRNYSASSQ